MNIAILGGTGKEGAGLATRWAIAGHSIIIGSRDPQRAHDKAVELRDKAHKIPIVGHSNREAAALPELRAECRDKIVISTVVPLTFGGPRLFTPPPEGSAAEQVQALLPQARVIAAFHHIAAHELSSDHPIDCDLLACGGDAHAKNVVTELGRAMGLRFLDVGPLSNAGPIEGITAVLATINRRYKLKNSGIKITGL
jgi:predicted dinucleotide-binding enzyme